MRRRTFLASTTAMLGGLPSLAATPARKVRIAMLLAREAHDPEAKKYVSAFRSRLSELGWHDDAVILDISWLPRDSADARRLASEAVARRPDIIMALSSGYVRAAQAAAAGIPIIFVAAADPVGQRFVASLARPGGPITGFAAEEPELGGKWLQLLSELVPDLQACTALYNAVTSPAAQTFFPAIQQVSAARAIKASIANVGSISDIEQVFRMAAVEGRTGSIILPDAFLFTNRESIVSFATQYRIPTIYYEIRFASAGGLLALGLDRTELFRNAADYADKVLKGTKPADLPVQLPTKFEIAINLKTAKALGLTIPPSIMLQATEVIE